MYKRKDGLYEKIITMDGKRLPFRAKTESLVNKKILAYKGKIIKGRTFKEVAEDWKEEHFKTIAYNSTKNYTPAYNRAVEHFGERYVKEIKPIDVQTFINDFAKTYAQKTVSTQLLVTNLIFSKAVLNSETEINPAAYVKIPKNLPKKRRNMPSEEDLKKVKENLDNPFSLFANFILYTGCRRGEALALQYKDVNYKNMTITINKSVYYVSNKPFIKSPKTQAGIREIILLDKLVKILPKGKPENYIFSLNGNEPLTQKRFSTLWKNYCSLLNLNITPHQLRHGYATMLFEAGIEEKDAQELLGHACISMTKDIYTHISKTRKEKTAELLNKFNS